MKLAVSLTLLTALFLVSVTVRAEPGKQIVGATELVYVTEADLFFRARIDTGAKTSSIHAERIEIDSAGDPRGKPISFYLVTKDGQSRKVETRVISVAKIRTADHSERRYIVPLSIEWNGMEKTVSVSLNDRGSMRYRLLLGRNWLQGDFLVDVDKNTDN